MTSKLDKPLMFNSSGSACSGYGTLKAVMFSDSGSGMVSIKDGASSGGTIMTCNTVSGTEFIDFSSLGGVPFKDGLYIDITSGSSIVHIWKE